jgi:hypothetical protein
MFDELMFEYRDLPLVLDVEVRRHGLDGIGRLGNTIVCMRHCWLLEVLEDIGSLQT